MRRILEDRSDLERELFLAATAEPDAARLDEEFFSVLQRGQITLPSASEGSRRIESAFRIGEVNDGLLRVRGGFIEKVYAIFSRVSSIYLPTMALSSQNLERVGVTGKILWNKELALLPWAEFPVFGMRLSYCSRLSTRCVL